MYRAPEMLDLYQNFPINEAGDIWVCKTTNYKIIKQHFTYMYFNYNITMDSNNKKKSEKMSSATEGLDENFKSNDSLFTQFVRGFCVGGTSIICLHEQIYIYAYTVSMYARTFIDKRSAKLCSPVYGQHCFRRKWSRTFWSLSSVSYSIYIWAEAHRMVCLGVQGFE